MTLKTENAIIWIIGAVLIAALAAGMYGMILNERKWQAFKAEHHCKVVVKNELFSDGWLCDDGITYMKSK